MLATLRPEARFLLSAVGIRQKIATEAITADFDWEFLLRIAYRNGLVPLLHHNMSKVFSGMAPLPFVDKLSSHANRISARSMILTRELLNVLDLFDSHGIEGIPYKGPVLAQDLYGSISLRQFDDLDLLIRKKDVLRAKDLLLQNDYTPKKELSDLTPAQERAFLGFHYTYDFVRTRSGHLLEVHWEIVPRSFSLRLDYEEIWKRSELCDFDGHTIRVLSREDIFMVLCIAGAKHLWNRLSRIRDIAQLLAQTPEMKWGIVLGQAKAAGAERIVQTGLHLAANLFEVPLPEDLMRTAKSDPKLESLSGAIVERLFSVTASTAYVLQEDDQFQPLHIKMRERTSDKIRYFLLVIFTPSVGEWALLQLPGFLYFLYYVLRPFRLLFKSISRIRDYFLAKAAISGAF